jgi:hypothetical protein
MTMKILALLLLVPSLAAAQGLSTSGPGASSERILRRVRFSEGCYPTPSGGAQIARATPGTYTSGAGTVVTCSANQIRVGPSGILSEIARTNYVLNSTTHPKTAEATASIGTGTAVARHAGSGTMTLAAGTATVTGLSCTTVAAGTLCTFTVTVAGTMTITTTAGTTRAQVESGSLWASSWIDTAGSATARSEDYVRTVGFPSLPSNWCIAATFQPAEGRAWSDTQGGGFRMLQAGSDGGANSFRLRLAGSLIFEVYDGAVAVKSATATIPGSFNAGSAQRIVLCNANGTTTINVGGAVISGANTGAGTGVLAATPTDMGVGGTQAGTLQFGGFVGDVKICAGSVPSRCR